MCVFVLHGKSWLFAPARALFESRIIIYALSHRCFAFFCLLRHSFFVFAIRDWNIAGCWTSFGDCALLKGVSLPRRGVALDLLWTICDCHLLRDACILKLTVDDRASSQSADVFWGRAEINAGVDYIILPTTPFD